MAYDRNTRLIDLTLGDLINILDDVDKSRHQTIIQQQHIPQYVFGIDGLAKHLGVSPTTIWRRKKSGEFKHAMTQVGRNIRTDITLLK